MGTWFERLSEMRTRLGVPQSELAARAQVSLPSVKAYEAGRRHPSRPYLVAMLDALKVDRSERNRILELAGYATDGYDIGPWRYPNFMFTREEACVVVDESPWPAFLSDETMHVPHANSLAQRLWGVDLEKELLDPIDRNLLSVASNPRFADRCVNLSEIVGLMASIWKGHHLGAEELESPSPLFGAILQRFMQGDPKYVQMFAEAWGTAPPAAPKIRWHYPVVWSDPDVGLLRFRGVVNPALEPDGMAFNDWVPVDAATWAGLEELRRRG